MFDFSPTTFFLTLIFSVIGIGYFYYGKKNNLYFTLSGIALMLYPYLISNVWPLLLWGLGLTFLPFILNKFYPL
ncbi:MAG: hypothetical protein K0S08_1984 [Gammaproteobacteria bacterium]|jgi:hypothetical protein|nr:hypothetical protein [Gammaproteobacteria bacterium]MCE3238235.1 hypothetical protein [Gammaproteobacteria bacterium]